MTPTLISIIGTRPQYIKCAAIDRRCKKEGISHVIIDTWQHYDKDVSASIIQDLGLNNVNYIESNRKSEIKQLSSILFLLENSIKNIEAKYLVYGDTNSSFAAAVVLHKLKKTFGHIEAGIRCGVNIPEELNRKYVDNVASVNFCSRLADMDCNNAIYSGDLEYELLNELNPDIEYGGFALLTLHRQENIHQERIQFIFDRIKEMGITTIFPIHHRLKNQPWFSRVLIPENIIPMPGLPYSKMVDKLSKCKFIITDSGSVPKIAPFFGKRCLILRNEIGWKEVIEEGYGKLSDLSDQDIQWAYDKGKRNKSLYMTAIEPSKIILNGLI